MDEKPIRVYDVKYKGIDDWNRPVYKVVGKAIYFGSTNKLFDGSDSKETVDTYFKENPTHMEFFGDHFNCEPHGGHASNWEFNIL